MARTAAALSLVFAGCLTHLAQATTWTCADSSNVSSPIDVLLQGDMIKISPTVIPDPTSQPVYKYRPARAISQRSSYTYSTIPACNDNFGFIELQGRFYTAVEISLYGYGIHTIGGTRYDGEIHIRHLLYGDWWGKDGNADCPGGIGVNGRRLEYERRLDAFAGNTHTTGDVAGGPSHELIVAIPVQITEGEASKFVGQLAPHELDFNKAYASHTDVKFITDTARFHQYKGSAIFPQCNPKNSIVHWIVYDEPLPAHADMLPPFASTDEIPPIVPLAGRNIYKDFIPPAAMGSGKDCNTFHAGEWTYADEQCWPEMTENDDTTKIYPNCAGMSQSPVSLITTESIKKDVKDNFMDIVRYHPVSEMVVYNNGHAIEADDRMNGDKHLGIGYITIGGDYYFVRQMNIHFPSEHVTDGEVHAAELHIVHQKQDHWGVWGDEVAIAAILFDIGEESPLVKQLFLPYEGTDGPTNMQWRKKMTLPMDLARHLGPVLEGDYYRYSGSFTTPPCDESVKWFVFKNPMSISLEQWNSFKAIFPNPANSRSVHPLKGREVAMNSFEAPGEVLQVPQYEFYLDRDSGRDRLRPSAWIVLWGIVGAFVLGVLTMAATFVRDNSLAKGESAGGLSSDPVGRGSKYERV